MLSVAPLVCGETYSDSDQPGNTLTEHYQNFYGTSENALRTQIWIAIPVYVLVAIVKKELQLDASLYRRLQICSVFSRKPLFHRPFL
ncbi:MAG: hypothetical protein QOH70_1310 [Blastocatellia bacterium]|jgi:hypothetical protein|nr:hypothetical protein [Blastocatellia bacterium]